MLRVAINGFGRIGRSVFKVLHDRKGVQVVAINDLTDPAILAHLLKYDSVYRTWKPEVKAVKNSLHIGSQKIPIYTEKDPAALPWGKHKIDVVVEATGRFTNMDDASKHVEAGAKRVVISAPAKEVPTFLMGVNHTKCKRSDKVVNNASCTTNSVAPVTQVLHDVFGVKKALMTTIHSVTNGQNVVDSLPSPRKPDLRRARSAMVNIIPTSTGAAKATTQVIPDLANKFDGISVRVPSITVSLSDIVYLLKKKTTVEEINKAFKKAASSARWKGVLGVTDEPLVSTDFVGSKFSTVVDLQMTRVVDGDLVKILAWYDNEWGYSERLADMVERVGGQV